MCWVTDKRRIEAPCKCRTATASTTSCIGMQPRIPFHKRDLSGLTPAHPAAFGHEAAVKRRYRGGEPQSATDNTAGARVIASRSGARQNLRARRHWRSDHDRSALQTENKQWGVGRCAAPLAKPGSRGRFGTDVGGHGELDLSVLTCLPRTVHLLGDGTCQWLYKLCGLGLLLQFILLPASTVTSRARCEFPDGDLPVSLAVICLLGAVAGLARPWPDVPLRPDLSAPVRITPYEEALGNAMCP